MQIESRQTVRLTSIAEDIATLETQRVEQSVETLARFHSTLTISSEIGGLLNSAKAMIGHGNFLAWLKDQCPTISERTARKYMALHANRHLLADLKCLKLQEAYELLGVSKPSPKKPAQSSDFSQIVISRLLDKIGSVTNITAKIEDISTLHPEERKRLAVALKPVVDIYAAVMPKTTLAP